MTWVKLYHFLLQWIFDAFWRSGNARGLTHYYAQGAQGLKVWFVCLGWYKRLWQWNCFINKCRYLYYEPQMVAFKLSDISQLVHYFPCRLMFLKELIWKKDPKKHNCHLNGYLVHHGLIVIGHKMGLEDPKVDCLLRVGLDSSEAVLERLIYNHVCKLDKH